MNKTSPTLAGRASVVTGGSRGIGFALADALALAGASVAITGRDHSRLDTAVSRLAVHGSRIVSIKADVRAAPEAARAIDGAAQELGRLDILINNAGVGVFSNVADMSLEQWRDVIETNLSGVFYCCNAAIPHLRRAGGGWIINISSLAGTNPFAGGAAYCASKAGLNVFSEALMQEVRYDNIRVSTVAPGSVGTGFAGRGDQGAADWKLAPEDVAQVVVDLINHPARSLPSRVELRPSKPQK
jgi:3-oxoacyl-[acyl-carrier protein] reductase